MGQVLKASGMFETEQRSQVVCAIDAPAMASALHAIADQREDITLHTAKEGMVYHSRLHRLGNINPPVVIAQQGIFVICEISQQFLKLRLN